jgi:hypothetical protein
MRISEITAENDRRDFMKALGKSAVAGAGALALGAFPTKAWPDEIPQNFDFMDQFLSDKVLNDPKYQEFKSVGEKLLKMMQDIEKEKNQKKQQPADNTISI